MLQMQVDTCRSSIAFDVCPFGDAKTNVCLASLSAMVIGPRNRQEYCSSENYDNCPVFLARMLRRR